MNAYVMISGEKYERVQQFKRDGLREFEAIAAVLNISPDANFCVYSQGTPSATRDGMVIVMDESLKASIVAQEAA